MRVTFREMKNSTRAPDTWQGGLNTPYRLGPGMQNPGWKVKLEVHTSNKMATIHNTIGIIRGEEEPGIISVTYYLMKFGFYFFNKQTGTF